MIDNACCCVDNDTPGPDVFSERTVTARKTHHCCECRAPIPPGTRYELAKGLWDGAWSTHRTCVTCDAVRRDVAPCSAYGDLWYDIRECWDWGDDNDLLRPEVIHD